MNANPPPPSRPVRCPGCGKLQPYDLANPARPFCSMRCRSADLAAWASESYRVSAAPGADAGDAAAGPDNAH